MREESKESYSTVKVGEGRREKRKLSMYQCEVGKVGRKVGDLETVAI